ncbi:MAG: hypothetical protein M1813_004723 [Trichoglossum hirsutum]|nr:MAG: hypothetical protein M1813_004723 [Trichoglossum hirsutum]
MSPNDISLLLVIGVLLHIPLAKADGGDDFSNNFAADIAPLLALFGESVAKQFMADSMGWKDNIIFAMAPLGIITAIVGAIRVSGRPKWLKSLIGRAREGRGDVEVELMSSTSNDVCELWNGQSIVRVMGSSSVMELVLYDELPTADDGDGDDGGDEHQRLKQPANQHHGIFKVSEAIQHKAIFLTSRDTESNSFEDAPPNMALNIIGKRSSNRELLAVAVFGTIIQAAVVVLAGLETYIHPWNLGFKKNGRSIDPYAFPLMVIGTSLLVLGMIMCSHIIEASSTEAKWGTTPGTRLAWVQKGDTINDQKFESFAFFSQDGHQLRKSIRDTKHDRESQVLIAAATSLVGFVVQFCSLRFLHWSITICQLTAIAIMTGLRAVVRRNLAHEPDAKRIPDGFELDWISKELNKCESWEVIPLETFPPTLERENTGLATAVVSARNRLRVISNWTGRYQKTAGSLTNAIEALINLAFTDNALLRDPELWSGKTEFEWVVAAKATHSRTSLGTVENVMFKLKRRRMDGGRWSLWQAEGNDIEALLGLWMLHICGHPPRAGNLDSGQSLRILSRIGDSKEEFGLWWPPGLEYFTSRDIEAKRSELGIPKYRVFGAVAGSTDQSEESSVIILDTSLHKICAQILFSTFLSQIAQHLSQINDVTVRSGTKRKFNSYGLISQTVSNIAEGLELSRLATIGDAYASIIPVLQICGTLPKSTDPKVFLSALQGIKKQEDDGLNDEAHDAALWLCHRLEATSMSYRSNGAWKDAGHVYLHYYKACNTVYNSSRRTKDAVRRMRRFEDIARELGDAEFAKLAELLHSKEWKDVKDASQAYKVGPQKQQLSIPSLIPSESIPLWRSVIEGDAAGVASILRESKAQTDRPDSRGRTPLIEASNQGFDAVVELLIRENAAVGAKDNDGQTSLHHAVKNQHVGVIELLLLRDERPLFEQDSTGQTPLSIAMEQGYKEIIKILNFYDVNDSGEAYALLGATTAGINRLSRLLGAGAQPDSKGKDGQTPLSWAAQNGREAVVELLLEKGAQLDSKDEGSRTPLSWAAENGHGTVVELLLEKGAQPDSKDKGSRTPLSWAAENGHGTVVELLLEKGTQPDSKDDYGRTPLSWAVRNGHEAVVKLLLEKGAQLGAQLDSGNKYGRTPLSWAAEDGHEANVKLLLEGGAQPDSKDKGSQTPLSWAARKGHEAVIMLLLEKGAQPDSKDEGSQTPLSWAARKGHEAVVKLLLEKGAQLDSKDEGSQTPLSWAAQKGHEAVVMLLLEKGAQLDSKDKGSRTPLSLAAGNGHEAVVKLLLEKGAQLDSKDKGSRTPLSWATENGHEAIVKLLTPITQTL